MSLWFIIIIIIISIYNAKSQNVCILYAIWLRFTISVTPSPTFSFFVVSLSLFSFPLFLRALLLVLSYNADLYWHYFVS